MSHLKYMEIGTEWKGREQGVNWVGKRKERHTVWPRARTLWATAVARRSGWDVDEAMMRFSCFAAWIRDSV
jgi:hypothetical protein